MSRPAASRPDFRRSLLALAAGAALAPGMAWALDLTQSPPGSVQPYVRPNVIISIDDSGSMGYRLDSSGSGGTQDFKVPNPDGTWDPRTPRMNILKYALIGNNGSGGVFHDSALLPDGKIRLAWQAMWNNGKSPGVGPKKSSGSAGATSVDSATSGVNSMKILGSTHRDNFIDFVGNLKAVNNTPSHWMFEQADAYMRRPLSASGPWASEPGVKGAPYLGCRRNYHIMMTDGRWNSSPSGGQRDGVRSLTLPDGTVYANNTSAQNAKVALYRDGYSDTLADWAFRSWADPLQTSGLTGNIEPALDYRNAPVSENFGTDSAGKPAILERYWNPKYNPATWPHMVTYTIGFSNDAITWPGASSIEAPSKQVPFGFDGSFPDLVTGTKSWPAMNAENKRALDLWHAALNGRGRFYAVNKGEDLEKAFREIFGEINAAADVDLGSSATSGSNVSRYDVHRYITMYEPDKAWKGLVKSEIIQTDGSVVSNPGWNGQTTSDKLDATGFSVGGRLVLSYNDKRAADGTELGGASFEWASDESRLSNAQKRWLQMEATVAGTDEGAARGEQRLNYVRGDRTVEGVASGELRPRQSRQGDIINSVVWYAGAPSGTLPLKGYSAFVRANKARTPMIYVGGNDGMLHGFSALDGTEMIAYVPRGIIPTLRFLTGPNYDGDHLAFVDGSPMTGDVDLGAGVQDPQEPGYNGNYQPDWRTLLVGTLGAGGKGYFVLDVTNPDGEGSTPGFSKTNASELVLLDRSHSARVVASDCITGLNEAQKAACNLAVTENKDIGHIVAQPVLDDADPTRSTQITRLNNSRWAVVLGNGYNSANQRPVLLVQYLDGDRELLRIPATTDVPGTGNAQDNGLAAPRLLDINGDGRPDVAYAGDNLGNLWKFDLTSIDDSKWKVAFAGQPLFTARGPASLGDSTRTKIQSITAAPTLRANDRLKQIGSGQSARKVAVGGLMVAFGTGRNAAVDDPESVDVHSLYSVLDSTHYCRIATSLGERLSIHPGGPQDCDGAALPDSIPAPAALGTGVVAAKLAKQVITEVDGGDFGTVDVADELDIDSWSNHNGWYMDFPSVGERLLKPMAFFDGSNILAVYSQVPAKGKDVDPDVESCDWTEVAEERQWRTLINIMDGKRPTVPLVDYNGDTTYDANDQGISRVKVSKGSHNLIAKGNIVLDIDTRNTKELLARMPEESMRPSWRQLR